MLPQDEKERFCITCGKMIPIEHFQPKKRQYRCIKHQRAKKSRSEVWGTPQKRAYFSMRTRAMQDMRHLGKDHIVFDEQRVTEMLANTKDATYSTHCFVPLDPEKPLAVPPNAALVTNNARRFIMANWRETRDIARYRSDLRHVMI
jgi:hypothetical protein